MRLLPFPTSSDEPVRQLVRDWIELLGDDKYEEALDLLYQDSTSPLGLNPEYSGIHWTPDPLRQCVKNYGLLDIELREENSDPLKIIKITDRNRKLFESGLDVDWIDPEAQKTWGLNPEDYAGIVHVGLPINFSQDLDGSSDVTARLLIRKLITQALRSSYSMPMSCKY